MAIVLCPEMAFGQGRAWQRYVIPTTGANVEVPLGVFSEDGGKPETGFGRRFLTSDRRANLTVQSFPNDARDSPAVFLAKQQPPPNIMYRRVTPAFFVVSSIRNGKIWYNRCNSAGRFMNCISKTLTSG
jgi:hypothetical protein